MTPDQINAMLRRAKIDTSDTAFVKEISQASAEVTQEISRLECAVKALNEAAKSMKNRSEFFCGWTYLAALDRFSHIFGDRHLTREEFDQKFPSYEFRLSTNAITPSASYFFLELQSVSYRSGEN